jgi:hypothetical protein
MPSSAYLPLLVDCEIFLNLKQPSYVDLEKKLDPVSHCHESKETVFPESTKVVAIEMTKQVDHCLHAFISKQPLENILFVRILDMILVTYPCTVKNLITG